MRVNIRAMPSLPSAPVRAGRAAARRTLRASGRRICDPYSNRTFASEDPRLHSPMPQYFDQIVPADATVFAGREASVFDIDFTLTTRLLGSAFATFLRAAGVVRLRRAFFRFLPDWGELTAVAWSYWQGDFLTWNALGAQIMVGLQEEQVTHAARYFCQGLCEGDPLGPSEPFLHPGSLELVRQARNKNHVIILASSSSYYACRAIGDFLGADLVIGNRTLLRADGRLTHRLDGPPGVYEGKSALVLDLLHRVGIPPERCWVYSDDLVLDLPLFERVGRGGQRFSLNCPWFLQSEQEHFRNKLGGAFLRTDGRETVEAQRRWFEERHGRDHLFSQYAKKLAACYRRQL